LFFGRVAGKSNVAFLVNLRIVVDVILLESDESRLLTVQLVVLLRDPKRFFVKLGLFLCSNALSILNFE